MIQRNLGKNYLCLFVLVWFWIAFGVSFQGEASAIPDIGEQSGTVSLESQDLYSQEVARLENREHIGLSIQHKKVLRNKVSWLLAALILWWLWRNSLSGKFWCDIDLKKAKKEYVDAFERRGPPIRVKVFNAIVYNFYLGGY